MIVVAKILETLAKPVVQWVMIGLTFAGLVTGFKYQQRAIGRDQAVTEIKEQAKEIADDAREARKPALRPGAADRLRKHSCRDC